VFDIFGNLAGVNDRLLGEAT
jgi:hypothetical protein